jgi:hypothetical protein
MGLCFLSRILFTARPPFPSKNPRRCVTSSTTSSQSKFNKDSCDVINDLFAKWVHQRFLWCHQRPRRKVSSQRVLWRHWWPRCLEPGWACKMRALVGLELYIAGWGLLQAWPGLVCRAWNAGLNQKSGLGGLGLFVYEVKARAWARMSTKKFLRKKIRNCKKIDHSYRT